MADALTERAAAYAARYDLLPEAGETALCAVSGGADSVCLLLVLRELAAERGFRLACAHYDHRLRGAESERDAAFVRELCERLGIPFYLGGGDVRAAAERAGKGLEETARELRYAFLRQTAAEIGASRLATAHTADDNAETALLFLARGAGSRGLAGIAPRSGRLVRPLLFAERREIEAYLTGRGERWMTDSSNFSADYARNRVRMEAVPALKSVNAAFVRHTLEAGERLREDDDYLRALAEAFLEENAEETEAGVLLPLSETAALPRPVFYRALRALCGKALAAAHVEAVRALLAADAGGASADLPGIRVTRGFDKLCFAPRGSETSLPERELPPNGELAVPEAGMLVRRTDGAVCPESGPANRAFTILYFKESPSCDIMIIRQRLSGDRLRLWGRGCSKSLKKLFAEARIPVFRRARTPVLACGDAVLAVPGLCAAEDRLARPGETAVRIEFQEILNIRE